jgi:predicted dehydrogenase
MKKLRCGFVGGGAIMRVHANVLSARPDVELAAVAEVSEPVLDAAAEAFRIPGKYADFHAMFDQEDLDFAVVCVPNAFHADATLSALRAGSHVLCEKPPAMNASQAEEMAQEAGQRNLRLLYGLHLRFSSETEAAHRYLEAGRLGDVYHASIQGFRRRGIPGLGSWFTTKAMAGGGALIDIGVHALDRAHYLMGRPKPVAASGVAHARFGVDPSTYNFIGMWGTAVPGGPFDVDDLSAAILRFENGASLMIQVSWAANTEEGSDLRVMGTQGGLQIDAQNNLKVISEDNGYIADITPHFKKSDPRLQIAAHFIDCIRNPELELRTDGRQGVVLQHMLDAIYRSAETNREVAICVPDWAVS